MTKDDLINSRSSGYTVMPNELFKLSLNTSEFRLMMVISKWDSISNKQLSVSYLGLECQMSKNTVMTHLNSLISKDLIITKGKTGKPRVHRVNWKQVLKLSKINRIHDEIP